MRWALYCCRTWRQYRKLSRNLNGESQIFENCAEISMGNPRFLKIAQLKLMRLFRIMRGWDSPAYFPGGGRQLAQKAEMVTTRLRHYMGLLRGISEKSVLKLEVRGILGLHFCFSKNFCTLPLGKDI